MNRRLPELEITVPEIREVLFEALGLDPRDEQFGKEQKVQDVIGMDSVAVLQFVVALESRYGISLEEDWLDLDRLMDLPSLARYIGERRQTAASSEPGDSGTVDR